MTEQMEQDKMKPKHVNSIEKVTIELYINVKLVRKDFPVETVCLCKSTSGQYFMGEVDHGLLKNGIIRFITLRSMPTSAIVPELGHVSLRQIYDYLLKGVYCINNKAIHDLVIQEMDRPSDVEYYDFLYNNVDTINSHVTWECN